MSFDANKDILKLALALLSTMGMVVTVIKVARRYLEKNPYRLRTGSALMKELGSKASKDEIKQWYRQALGKIVTARLQAECSITSGEPIFLSHYISKGRLRHWVLHVHEHKYELRQVLAKRSCTAKRYKASISPSSFDLLAYQRSVTLHHSPKVGNYFYSMIGWTTLSKKDVDDKCDEVGKSFGSYALFTNNCHDFLQCLADAIVTRRAPDWEWFRDHDVTGYQYTNESGLGYGAISAATCSGHLKRSKHYLGADERMKVDDFVAVLDKLAATDCTGRDLSWILTLIALPIHIGLGLISFFL